MDEEKKHMINPPQNNQNEVSESRNLVSKKNTSALLYRIDEHPPWYLALLLGFQHYLTMFGATVGLPFVISQYLCFGDDGVVISEVLSTLFFCSGLVTLVQTTFGVRLPIVQGGSYTFIAPMAAVMSIRPKCADVLKMANTVTPTTGTMINQTIATTAAAFFNSTTSAPYAGVEADVEWKVRMREIQGALILSSLFQIIIGFTGVMGFVLKYIGPLTIAPTIALVGLPLFETAAYFAGAQWGVTLVTMFFIALFSQVLKDVEVPIFRSRLPIFKLFPVLLAIFIAWILSAILTVSGAYGDKYPRARTDYRSDVLAKSAWFRVPYPCQWGMPTVSAPAVFGMLAGLLASMIESIGDYYACARLSGAPPPPKHALNRGLGFEGLGCLLTGLWGTGNGTTSYSENIGAIGITKVGSVRVVQCGAFLMIILSVIGKFGALFVTVPDPVVGGIFTIMFGMITAVGLSSLQFVDLSSMRNLFVLGTSLFMGMVVPHYVKTNGVDIGGISSLSQIVQVLLSTNMAIGGITGFILDNSIPGTKQERGIISWKQAFDDTADDGHPVASIHVYDPPFLSERFMKSSISRLLPFLPYYGNVLPVNEGEDVKMSTY